MEKPQVKHDIMQTQDNFKWTDALLLEKSNKPLSKKNNSSLQMFENWYGFRPELIFTNVIFMSVTISGF